MLIIQIFLSINNINNNNPSQNKKNVKQLKDSVLKDRRPRPALKDRGAVLPVRPV